MKNRHILIICLLLLTSIGRSQVRAWQDPPPRRALDPNLFVIRLLLGVGDDATRSWNGEVRLDQGEVAGLEGWRFRKGDELTGPRSWRAQSRLIRRGKPAPPPPPARSRRGAEHLWSHDHAQRGGGLAQGSCGRGPLGDDRTGEIRYPSGRARRRFGPSLPERPGGSSARGAQHSSGRRADRG